MVVNKKQQDKTQQPTKTTARALYKVATSRTFMGGKCTLNKSTSCYKIEASIRDTGGRTDVGT